MDKEKELEMNMGWRSDSKRTKEGKLKGTALVRGRG
jgi:hypothetical protein